MAPYRSRSITPEERLARGRERRTAAARELEEARGELRAVAARTGREALRLRSTVAMAEKALAVAQRWAERALPRRKRPGRSLLSVDDARARLDEVSAALERHPVTLARAKADAAERAWEAAAREVADAEAIVAALKDER